MVHLAQHLFAMTSDTASPPFAALDACHQDIQLHLARLQTLIGQLEQGTTDAHTPQNALEITEFFTTVARKHHADEEEDMFPAMIKKGTPERIAQIRSLIEDHFWIEKYWHDLAPLLNTLSASGRPADATELIKVARLFFALCSRHIEFEESMIYPVAKARASTT